MQTINRRKDDLIKACKYHYRRESLSTMEVVRRVIAVHNGVRISAVTDDVLLRVLLADTADLVFVGDGAVRMLTDYLSAVNTNTYLKRMKGDWDAKAIGSTEELIVAYISRVTWISAEDCGGSLPENCPVVEQAIILPEDY